MTLGSSRSTLSEADTPSTPALEAATSMVTTYVRCLLAAPVSHLTPIICRFELNATATVQVANSSQTRSPRHGPMMEIDDFLACNDEIYGHQR